MVDPAKPPPPRWIGVLGWVALVVLVALAGLAIYLGEWSVLVIDVVLIGFIVRGKLQGDGS